MSISTSESSSLVRRWSVCAKATTAMSLSGRGADLGADLCTGLGAGLDSSLDSGLDAVIYTSSLYVS
jgi:hypothetical protein